MGFDEKYRQLKTRLERYRSEDILFWALNNLHKVENRPLNEDLALMPWELLSLARLGIIYGGRKYPPKIASENDMRILLNKIKDTSSESPILNKGGPHKLHKFLRVTAHQQMIYQVNMSTWKLGRQIQLFQLLPCKYPISEKFQEYTGLAIEEFFEIALIFLVLMMGDSLALIFDPATLYQSYPKETIFKFLDVLALDWQTAKNDLLSPDLVKVRDPQLQFFDQTPFIRYPFIKYKDGKYIYISQKVFEQTVGNFIYDLLKAKDSNEFSQEFGKTTFENYLELGLKYAQLSYVSESALKAVFPKNQKVVDFTILDEECTVLIECKAIEMKPYTKVQPDTDIMSREFKSSVVKALEQIYSVARELKETDEITGKKVSSNVFALVVTYKELFFGPGEVVWEEFLKGELASYLEREGIDLNILPPHKICYISVEGFDHLINVLSNSNHKLHEILAHIAEHTQNPQTMKFVFDWYLTDDFRLEKKKNNLMYIQEPTAAIFKKITTSLGYKDIEELEEEA